MLQVNAARAISSLLLFLKSTPAVIKQMTIPQTIHIGWFFLPLFFNSCSCNKIQQRKCRLYFSTFMFVYLLCRLHNTAHIIIKLCIIFKKPGPKIQAHTLAHIKIKLKFLSRFILIYVHRNGKERIYSSSLDFEIRMNVLKCSYRTMPGSSGGTAAPARCNF